METLPKFKTIKKREVFTDKHGNDVVYPEIIMTKDYSWLKTLPHNRPLVRSAIKQLGASIALFGMLRLVVIIRWNLQFYQGDGQHLIQHAIESDLPIMAFVIDVDEYKDTMKIVTTLNNTSRGWSLTQYVRGWGELNGGDYKRLMELRNTYGVSFTLLGAILMGTTQPEAKKKIKNGEFQERVDVNRVNLLLEHMNNFELLTGIRMRHTHTAAGLVSFINTVGVENYKAIEDKFIEAVKKHNKKNPISPFARKTDSEELWMRIYSKM